MFRPLPVMSLCVAASLAVLFVLGGWQWARYQDKLSQLDTTPAWTAADGDIAGTLWLSTIQDGQAAWRALGILDRSSGDTNLVTLGLAIGVNAPSDVPTDFGRVDLSRGIFRPIPAKSVFAASPDLVSKTFYGFDVDAMGTAASRNLAVDMFEPEMIFLRTDDGRVTSVANPWADPSLADPLPPARHLGYALTWWGIALGLIILYLVYHIQAGRLRLGSA
ncbi:MAG: SURF1 family cytochrome oxidase biogenesis protein [Pseudomonadota bacterium]